MTHTIAFLPNIGGWEWIGLLVIALLLFGKRLPEVGRSLGKGIVEFRKGVQGLQDEVEEGVRKPTANSYGAQASNEPGPAPQQQIPAAPSQPADAPTPTGPTPTGQTSA